MFFVGFLYSISSIRFWENLQLADSHNLPAGNVQNSMNRRSVDNHNNKIKQKLCSLSKSRDDVRLFFVPRVLIILIWVCHRLQSVSYDIGKFIISYTSLFMNLHQNIHYTNKLSSGLR